MTLLIPVVLIVWTRARKRSLPGQPMTTLEFITAGTTIAAGAILLAWLVRAFDSIAIVAVMFGVLAVPAGLFTWGRARRRRRQGRPMTGLQLTASVVFLAVLLPALLLMSLVVAGFLICLATGPPSFH